jgi:hypothetical protein
MYQWRTATGNAGRLRRWAPAVMALLVTGLLLLTPDLRSAAPTRFAGEQTSISGPVAWLLAASTDLGLARSHQTSVAAALRGTSRPRALIEWATGRHLAVQWEPGAGWAYLTPTRTPRLTTTLPVLRPGSRSCLVLLNPDRTGSVASTVTAATATLDRLNELIDFDLEVVAAELDGMQRGQRGNRLGQLGR